tara:strand:- start:188 stop:607 length:420 start_codon:yes stop_codon:yes gene_type:complete
MRFYAPGPEGVVAPGIRVESVPYASAGRAVYGTDKVIVMGFTANSGELYEGEAGNNVVVTLYRISATRFALQFWNSITEVQIGGNIVTSSGLADIITQFNADAVLSNLFFVRGVDTTNRDLVDTGAGLALGKAMSGGQG